MRRLLVAATVLLVTASAARADGILIPEEKSVPPLAMLSHHVTATVEDQVAITEVEQVFRNHTGQKLEATYIFPVPKGASVRQFVLTVDGKEMAAELVKADTARKIYTEVVSRSMDPALLEYIGQDMLRIKVLPVPPNGDAKIKVSYTSLAPSDNGVIEYVYPLKTGGKAVKTLQKFSLSVNLKSQHAIQNIYSPTHNVTTTRPNDKTATVTFEKEQAVLDKDFQLYYTAGTKDVGLTALTHRGNGDEPGYFLLLAAPRVELSREQQIPRDMVFVLDTSGSMQGKRMTQARNALKFCLKNLGPKDRFGLMNFSTLVHKYKDGLLAATPENVAAAMKWVDALKASGGTAIDAALTDSLAMRTDDAGRPFTIVFFTDGEPTVGVIDPDAILKNVAQKNTASTRIFTFGVGDEVNAALLDRLAEQTRAVSTYVRETEDIEAKVSSLYGKISNPVLANLKLSVSPGVTLSEVYPPHLPDLFHGTQLVVLGRYTGDGKATIKLTGMVGKDTKEFVYELQFPAKTQDEKPFVEDLWARRKVGFLLDQIRLNGDKKELVDEIILLAKRYGITTPYTSYLICPDTALPVVGKNGGGAGGFGGHPEPPAALQTGAKGKDQAKVTDYVKGLKDDKKVADERRKLEVEQLNKAAGGAGGPAGDAEKKAAKETQDRLELFEKAKFYFDKRDKDGAQTGKFGVDFAVNNNNLRSQSQLTNSAVRKANYRNCLEVGGIWIDDGFDPKMKTVAVKAMSKAYFRILELQPKMKEVFALGNHLVWVTPSGTALVIDTTDGVQTMEDADIERLFASSKK
jgi:Ca-activated chloride channel family protein